MHFTYQLPKYRVIEGFKTNIIGRPVYAKHVPFKEVLPFTLKNSVSGKSERTSGAFALVCVVHCPQFRRVLHTRTHNAVGVYEKARVRYDIVRKRARHFYEMHASRNEKS
jgi:hypothetical protein